MRKSRESSCLRDSIGCLIIVSEASLVTVVVLELDLKNVAPIEGFKIVRGWG